MAGLNLLPPRVAFTDADGLLTREGYAFLRSVFNRVGGVNGMASDDLAVLAAFDSGDVSTVDQVADQPIDLAAQVAELSKQVAALQRQLAAVRDPAQPVLRNDLDNIRKEIALIPDYSIALAQLGSMAKQNANAVAITGGNINNTAIGATTRSTGRFSTVGVGIAAPAYRFVVSNNGAAGLEFDSDGAAYAGTTAVLAYNRTAGAYVPLNLDASAITLRVSGTRNLAVDAAGIGFLGGATAARQNVTGSRGGNVALASLLSALATFGLITDSTTA